MQEKTLGVVSAATSPVGTKFVGNGDAWLLLGKASHQDEGWMKTSKAYEIPGVGCVVQSETQQKNIDGTYSLSMGMAFVPGVKIEVDVNGGRKLVKG